MSDATNNRFYREKQGDLSSNEQLRATAQQMLNDGYSHMLVDPLDILRLTAEPPPTLIPARPRVSTFEMSESVAVRSAVERLIRSKKIEYNDKYGYPWHGITVLAEGKEESNG